MTIQTYLIEDGECLHNSIEVQPNTRFNDTATAKVNDCKYCAFYLGRYGNKYVCNMDICPAELVGYNATKLYAEELKEVTA